MSYLGLPRIHFAGGFRADPSTIDNILDNYDPGVTLSDANTLWNPFGTHVFRLAGCRVSGVVGPDGVTLVPGDDPVLGAAVESTDDPYPAKLVDLDPDQQTLSQVIGLRVRVILPDGSASVTGRMRPASLNDLWPRVPSLAGIRSFGAVYQSVLEGLDWRGAGASPLLDALRAAGPDRLSIKFSVDGFEPSRNRPNFGQGRVTGTIGPATDAEPTHSIAGRRLLPMVGGFGPCVAVLDEGRRRLVLDLGNAIANAAQGGPAIATTLVVGVAAVGTSRPTAAAVAPHAPPPPAVVASFRAKAGIAPDPRVEGADSAPLRAGPAAAARADSAAATPLPDGVEPVGQVEFTEELYRTLAGVVELPVTDEQASRIAAAPLSVYASGAADPGAALAEDPSGLYVDVSEPLLRLDPGETGAVDLIALRFGRPAAGLPLDLALIQTDPAQAHNNLPADALGFPARVTTDARGRAQVEFTARPPVGKPTQRQHIDGQIYYVGGPWQGPGGVIQAQGNGAISLLVFDAFDMPSSPTWADVQPILAPYVRLTPYMKTILDLSSYDDVARNADRLLAVMGLSAGAPHYMPVLRDLSEKKRTTVLNWLRAGAPRA